jgi:hypothetical protein
MDLIIKNICCTEESLNSISWIERVPSQSNPADVLSRELVLHHLGLSRTETDLEAMWQRCTDATLLQGKTAMASDSGS